MILELKKVCSTGPFLYKKYPTQKTVLKKEKLDKIGARLEHRPPKSLT
jgi:hypothetical protein